MGPYGYLIGQLNRFNLTCLHLVEGSTAASREPLTGVGVLRRQFNGPYITNSGYTLKMALAAPTSSFYWLT